MPVEVVFIVVAALTAVTLWVYMGTRSHPGGSNDALDALEKRLARLEVAIDDMSSELGRVTEGQQFLTKALADRPRDMIEARHER